jgi:hypothetical protein
MLKNVLYIKIILCIFWVLMPKTLWALNSDVYEFIYAYKVDNQEQYIVEVARTSLLSGIDSKKHHPSTVVHWLLIDRAHNAHPLKLKWLDEVREQSSDISKGEIQQRTFAGYQLYSEINSGKAIFSYDSGQAPLYLKRIKKDKEFDEIDQNTLNNIALYLDNFYRTTYLIDLVYQCKNHTENDLFSLVLHQTLIRPLGNFFDFI